eukprot:6066077-Prymnesium_polylepis.1
MLAAKAVLNTSSSEGERCAEAAAQPLAVWGGVARVAQCCGMVRRAQGAAAHASIHMHPMPYAAAAHHACVCAIYGSQRRPREYTGAMWHCLVASHVQLDRCDPT